MPAIFKESWTRGTYLKDYHFNFILLNVVYFNIEALFIESKSELP